MLQTGGKTVLVVCSFFTHSAALAWEHSRETAPLHADRGESGLEGLGQLRLIPPSHFDLVFASKIFLAASSHPRHGAKEVAIGR